MAITSEEIGRRRWSKATSVRLLLIGILLFAVNFIVVLSKRSLVWHSQRDLELRETYNAFLETGTLLIKAIGTGSYNVQAPGEGPWVSAAWDDDPGAYIVGSLMGLFTRLDSPYPGLGLAVALLAAIPMLWLPTAVARLFNKPVAGYVIAFLPLVMWFVNNGSFIAGSQYGLSDKVAETPVYAIYGIAASLAFLSLSLLLLLCTFKMTTGMLVLMSMIIVVLAAAGNLARSLSGIGVALGVGLLWWLHSSGRMRRLAVGLTAAAVAVVLAVGLQHAVMQGLNSARAHATQQDMQDLPNSHGTWHPLYIGLAWPEPITGQPSPFDVRWDDLFGWSQAQKVDPDVVVGSAEYDQILKDYYLDAVLTHPFVALKLYLQKFFYVLHHFAAMILFVVFGGIITYLRRSRERRALPLTATLVAPTLALGLIPPIAVMPMLYYYSELTAALSLLVAVALGGVAWSLSLFSRERKQSFGTGTSKSACGSTLSERVRSGELPAVSGSLNNHE
ncbi:MAG: hypothetical protein E6Q27_08815 [Aeromicrobium sp.]|nr:MAG: hypothetical protein E6Q27_08815 [Aeromicrobium sp.]